MVTRTKVVLGMVVFTIIVGLYFLWTTPVSERFEYSAKLTDILMEDSAPIYIFNNSAGALSERNLKFQTHDGYDWDLSYEIWTKDHNITCEIWGRFNLFGRIIGKIAKLKD